METPAPKFAALSASDRKLLTMRLSEVTQDKELFRRYVAIHTHREHPDSGEPIDFASESKEAAEAQYKQDATAVQQADASDSHEPSPSRTSTAMDMLQLGLDAVGTVEPTPFADGTNAAISLFRAFVSDPERRREHLQNGGISALSVIPYVGDLAKLTKIPRATKTVQRAGKMHETSKTSKAASGAADLESVKRIAKTMGLPVEQVQSLMAEGRLTEAGESVAAAAGGSGAGGSGGNVPPTATLPPVSRDPDKDPREVERRIAGQRKLQDLNDDFKEKLVDSVLALGAFGAALVAGAKGIERVISINRGYVDANKHLAEYDAGVASSYMQHEVAEMRRNITKGKQLRDAVQESTEADSAWAEVRDRFSTPIDSMKMDASATATKVMADLTAVGDNLSGFSDALQAAKVVTDFFSDGITGVTGGMKSLSEYLSPTGWIKYGFSKLTGEAAKAEVANPNAPPWQNFLDDIRDGKFDGESKAGAFFTKDF